MTGRRLENGGLIDRDRPLSFTWEGQKYHGFAGDSLASALLANGVRIIGRSFKYHRPRGFMAAGVDDPTGIVDLTYGARHDPNARAATLMLKDGMEARSIHGWPSADVDALQVLDFGHRILGAGFYYKIFTGPSWARVEGMIRRLAGLGTARSTPDMRHFDSRDAHCDLLVIGGGLAGLIAAKSALSAGLKVIVVDDNAGMGGALKWSLAEIDGQAAYHWARTTINDLQSNPNCRLITQATAFGYYDDNLVGVMEQIEPTIDTWGDARLWRIRAGHVVLATGAIERPLVFENNDRPGAMMADATARYAGQFAVLVAPRIVIATNNDSAYQAAGALALAGAEVTVVDCRARAGSASLQAEAQGVRMLRAARVTNAQGRRGVTAVDIRTDRGSRIRIEAEVVASSGGFQPNVHLFSQAGGTLEYDPMRLAFLPKIARQKITAIGGAAGIQTLAECIEQAHEATAALIQEFGRTHTSAPPRTATSSSVEPIMALWHDPQAKGRQWVDLQNDVTVKDIEAAADENYVSVEHLKRYTTLGMATDQGKTSNVIGLAILGEATGRPIPDVGTTTFRPPFVPVSLGAIAGPRFGKLYAPIQRLPAQDDHSEAGAVFREYGHWWRPAYYRRSSEREAQAITREALAVRNHVGLLDVSSLGKIAVRGPDAAAFLNLIFYNEVANLKTGHLRYCFMLRETGVVFDDGVVARLADDHYLLSPSSSHTKAALAQLQLWHQTEYPHFRVAFSDLTSAYATISIAGPKSRALLERLDLGADLSDTALPHMAIAQGIWAGRPFRLARVSFTGERAYELSVPAGIGASLWRLLLSSGEDLRVTPFGLETLSLLRAEKGYILIGTDSDGTTLPMDLGQVGPLSSKKIDYVGRRSLFTPDAARSDRRQLVGLIPADPQVVPKVGSHIIEEQGDKRRSLGWITSSGLSPTLGHSICLAMVESGRRLIEAQAEVKLFDRGTITTARVTSPSFLDPAGERLRG
jgi:sarcosine oxidase subunit alpha